MSAYRNNQDVASHAAMSLIGRKVLCAFVACALTGVLLGEVGKSVAQSAQGAAAEQNNGAGALLCCIGANRDVTRAGVSM